MFIYGFLILFSYKSLIHVYYLLIIGLFFLITNF